MYMTPGTNPRDRYRKQIHYMLRTWHKPGKQINELGREHFFASKAYPDARKMLIECMEALAKEDEQGALILQERFIQDNTILAVAHQLHLSPDQLNRRQRQAIKKLTDIVISREKMIRETRSTYLLSHLQTPTYSHLFGFDKSIDTLRTRLIQTEPPWVISITGIGGIGKTTLAEAVSRQALDQFHFEDITWLRAQNQPDDEIELNNSKHQDFQQSLAEILLPDDIPPAEKSTTLQQLLKSSPHLIVVDNLHTEE
jgi:hypothetical protein